MKITKKTALFIIVSLILVISSCSAEKDADTGSGPAGDINITDTAGAGNAAEELKTEIKDSLPDNIDYGGYEFRIFIRDHARNNMDFYIESEVGEQLNDAVYNRNKKVEERFNVNFKFNLYPYEDWAMTAVSNTVKAGDDAFDMAAIHGATVFTLSNGNLILNWYENMPYIDLSAPWWPDGIIGNISSFGKLYGITGDISYTYLDYAGCLLFNKDLFKNLSIEYPYADATNGKWTLDKFISIVKDGKADLNGDGVMTPDADRYGLDIMNAWAFPNEVFYCGGDKMVSINIDGIPELTMYNDRTVSIYDKFFDMLDSGAAQINELNVSTNPFKEGRALFYNGALGDIIENRALEFDIGILPLPKYDEKTPKYFIPVNQNTSMIVAPVTLQNTERTSIITEALAAEGYRTVIPAYYEISLKTKQARDDESAAMMDYIRDGIICDYGQFDVTAMGSLLNFGAQLVQSKNTSFTVIYDRNKAAVERNIEKLKEKYGY